MHNRFSSWGGRNTFCTSWNCTIKKQNRWMNTNQCWWKKDQNVQLAVPGVSTHESIWGRMTVRWHFFNICQGNLTWMYPPFNDSGLALWKLYKGTTSKNLIVRSSIYYFQALLVSASFASVITGKQRTVTFCLLWCTHTKWEVLKCKASLCFTSSKNYCSDVGATHKPSNLKLCINLQQ